MRRPDSAGSRVVLVGTGTYSADRSLQDLPSVLNNLTDLVSALSQPAHGWFAEENCTVVRDPARAEEIHRRLAEVASQAEDLLLVYFAGHGLLDSRGNLYLGLSETRRDLLRYTAMPFDGVRELVADSPARNRVVILDCCYSGRAIDVLASDDVVMDQTQITGSYTLTATASGVTALAPSGEQNTAFTGQLLRLLREGDPRAPEDLTLDHVYRSLYRGLRGRGLPEPRRQGTDTVEDLVLARNLGYRPSADGGAESGGRLLVDDAEQLGHRGDPEAAARRYAEISRQLMRFYGADSANVRSAEASAAFWTHHAAQNTGVEGGPAPSVALGRAVGIDFGTTNSVIGILDGGVPTVITNAEGARTTPSVVAFATNGAVLVGEVAKRQAVTNAERTVGFVKQHLGTDWKFTVDGKEFGAPQIAAFILQKLKRDAEGQLGEEVTDVALTVPAHFGDAERQAIKEAAEIAGFTVLRIINEPTTAVLAYGLEVDLDADPRAILVVSLGGGTFDVSVLEVLDGVLEVKVTNGDNHLGGDDWDQRIVDYLVKRFQEAHGVVLSGDMMASQRLREAAEKAKIELSSATAAVIDLPYIFAGPDGPLHLEETLTRAQFQQLTADLLERCKAPFRMALLDADVDLSRVDHIVLVGGATRMPAVAELVKELTGNRPIRSGLQPDEVVALGAAFQAAILQGDFVDGVLLDVAPQSLGIETAGGVMTKIIEKNTPIPTKRSEIFTTAEDNQRSITIEVFRGEHEMAADNERVGTVELQDLPPAPRGVPQIEVTFEIDADNAVQVTARDLATGKEQRITGS
jgi:molecular chaperone DnaK